MKKITYLLMAASLLLLIACPEEPGKLVDPKETILNEKLKSIVSSEMMKTIRGMGMPVYFGTTPPNIEGTYLVDDQTMKQSSFNDDDPPGKKYEEEVLTLSDQDNDNFIVTLTAENGIYTMLISGKGDDFTLYASTKVLLNDNTRANAVILYSGTFKKGELYNLHKGLFITDGSNFGKGRIYYEADGVAKKIAGEESVLSGTIGKSGGNLQANTIDISIPVGSFSADTKMELKKHIAGNVFGNSRASDYHTIAGLPADFTKPITITVTPAEDAGANLLMAMGEESFVPSLNKMKLNYSFVESTLKDGKYVFELQPPKPDNDAKGKKMDLTFGLVKDYVHTGVSTKAPNAGKRFNIHYNKFHVHDYEAEQLEAYLDAAYDELVKMGFSFSKRTKWPVEVNFNNSQSDEVGLMGEFCSSKFGNNYGTLSFYLGNMPNEDLLKSTAGHELFHLVKALYDPRWAYTKAVWASDFYWFDEATSTWFEEVMAGKGYSSATRKENELFPLIGIYRGPQVDAQHYGYGMAAFVKYIINQTDKTILSKIYQKIYEEAGDAVKIINGLTPNSISEMYPNFLEEYLTGKIYPDFEPQKLLSGVEYGGIEKWAIRSKGDIQNTVEHTYPGISAKIFRVRLLYNGFQEYDELRIETDNTLTVPKYVFEVRNGKFKFLYTGRSEFYVPKLKQLQKENGQVVVLVANAGYVDEKVKTTFTVIPQTKGIALTTAKSVGEKVNIYIESDNTSKVWIDLNNNGKKEKGENWRKDGIYTLGATTIRIYGDVSSMDCSDGKFTSIDASGSKTLRIFYSCLNQLTSLNLSGCTALRGLVFSIDSASSTSLNVKGCTSLERIECDNTQITSLDVSECIALHELRMHNSSKLTSLNVRGCTEMKELICRNAQLSSLDVSGLTNLRLLYCNENKLTSLKLDGTTLYELDCRSNNLCEARSQIFDNITILHYDIRYEYKWSNMQMRYIVEKDHGKGYWYPHEPEGGCHRPTPCNN